MLLNRVILEQNPEGETLRAVIWEHVRALKGLPDPAMLQILPEEKPRATAMLRVGRDGADTIGCGGEPGEIVSREAACVRRNHGLELLDGAP